MNAELIIHSELDLDKLLKQWQELRLITPLDRHFALQMSQIHQEHSPLFTLICLLVSQQLSNQHTCLLLSQINLANPLNEQTPSVAISGDHLSLIARLSEFGAIERLDNTSQMTQANKPLVLENGRLYLQRYHHYEREVARHLIYIANADDAQSLKIDNLGSDVKGSKSVQSTLDMLFPTDAIQTTAQIDWQKIATATAYNQKLAIITGGPGTGKTTTVTKLLYLLQHQYLVSQAQRANKEADSQSTKAAAELTIKLVAPTGKAAARLSESIKASKRRLSDTLIAQGADYSPLALSLIPEQASTLHRLLGVIPNSHRFRHHKENPLHLDLLIVDEASMVDLPMMHRLLDAMPDNARLILLGDQDQLASVEAGAVLADICQGLKQEDGTWRMRYTPHNAATLSQLCHVDLSQYKQADAKLGDSLCMLTHSHRFRDDAGIGQLAKAVNNSDAPGIMQVWQQGYQELLWIEHELTGQNQNLGLSKLLIESVQGYGQYLEKIKLGLKQDSDAETIINAYNQFRILCAMRNGEYGVQGINQQVEQALKSAGKINPAQEFYIGRPVIIGSNDYNLGLFNGDIGLILPDPQRDNRAMAYFIQADASILKILPARLPNHETCYAMTVHKSQGSEFEHVAMVLPPKPSLAQKQLLTKELIYTGITRAKLKFICLGSVPIFEGASLTSTQRASGLADRLWQ